MILQFYKSLKSDSYIHNLIKKNSRKILIVFSSVKTTNSQIYDNNDDNNLTCICIMDSFVLIYECVYALKKLVHIEFYLTTFTLLSFHSIYCNILQLIEQYLTYENQKFFLIFFFLAIDSVLLFTLSSV